MTTPTIRYTTYQAINRRLDGRVQIGGVVPTLGGAEVTHDLILQIASQVEAEIDGIIGLRYQLPLTSKHLYLSEVTELGTICKILGQYYVAQDPSNSAPADASYCAEYRRALLGLQKSVLPGEILIDPIEQGSRWTTIGAAIRDLPTQTVSW